MWKLNRALSVLILLLVLAATVVAQDTPAEWRYRGRGEVALFSQLAGSDMRDAISVEFWDPSTPDFAFQFEWSEPSAGDIAEGDVMTLTLTVTRLTVGDVMPDEEPFGSLYVTASGRGVEVLDDGAVVVYASSGAEAAVGTARIRFNETPDVDEATRINVVARLNSAELPITNFRYTGPVDFCDHLPSDGSVISSMPEVSCEMEYDGDTSVVVHCYEGDNNPMARHQEKLADPAWMTRTDDFDGEALQGTLATGERQLIATYGSCEFIVTTSDELKDLDSWMNLVQFGVIPQLPVPVESIDDVDPATADDEDGEWIVTDSTCGEGVGFFALVEKPTGDDNYINVEIIESHDVDDRGVIIGRGYYGYFISTDEVHFITDYSSGSTLTIQPDGTIALFIAEDDPDVPALGFANCTLTITPPNRLVP